MNMTLILSIFCYVSVNVAVVTAGDGVPAVLVVTHNLLLLKTYLKSYHVVPLQEHVYIL